MSHSAIAQAPYVSIILPIRNEVQYIQRSLDAVLRQDYPPNHIEVLVADGMSDDGTRDIVLRCQEKMPNLRLIDNLGKIVPIGMNTALRQARGEIIIRVDGHCEIASDYTRKCVNHLLEDSVDGAGGSMQTIGETPLSETIAVCMSSSFGVGGSAFRTITGISMIVDTIPFPAYTKKIIEKVGLYDEELVRNQDDEYNYRIRDHGGKLLLADDIRSKYYSRGTLSGLWKQYFQYGFWKVRVMQKHPKQMRLRQFVPPVFAAALIFSSLFTLIFAWGWMLLALIVGSYFVANLTASIITTINKEWKHFPLLPLTFAILHLSYGLGFLIGLVKFANRWRDKIGRVPVLGNNDARTS